MAVSSGTSTLRKRGALRDLVTRRPLLAYFVIAFGAVWVAMLPLVLGQSGLGLLPVTVPERAFIGLFIGGVLLGPTGGALVVIAAAEGRPGVRRSLRRHGQWRVGTRWYLLALLGYFALYLAAVVIAGGPAPLATFAANWPLLGSTYPLALLNMILGPALDEDPGWSGFALPISPEYTLMFRGTYIARSFNMGSEKRRRRQ